MRERKVAVGLAMLALIAAACSSGGGATTAPSAAPTTATSGEPTTAGSTEPSAGTVGEGEGALTLVAWTNYVMGGTGGEPVPAGGYDWVTPFEQATGCKTTVKVGASSSEMVQLMKTGEYDGVSESVDSTLGLIAGGDVVAIDTGLFPN
jgi:putative spermidine/putrescine transport system substrate-binding protein